MKKSILMIINPCSGMNKSRGGLAEATKVFESNGCDVTVLNTTKTGDATDYARIHGDKYDSVICRGGDGTFCEMMNGIMALDKKPQIGYIPAGTTNDMGNTLGLSFNPEDAAKFMVKEDALPCDIGEFNGKFFTYVASFGALTECSYAAPQSLKNKVGRLAYYLEGAKEIKDIHPIPMRVTVDGKTIEGNFVFGAISNSYTIAKVIKLDTNYVCLNDGKFEILLVDNPKTIKGWAITIISALRKKFDERYIKLIQGSHVELEVLDGSPLPWTLDGEYGGDDNKVVIDVHKHAYNMFRPRLANEDESAKETVNK